MPIRARPFPVSCLVPGLVACLAWGAATGLAAAEPPAELRPALARLDSALSAADKAYHEAQAKAKEEAVKDFDKLLKAERKKSVPLLTVELDQRILALNKEIALLRDEPLMKATTIDAEIARKEYTAAEWDALPAMVFTVDAKESRNNTRITVGPGQLYYVVPHPEDTWQSNTGATRSGWRGEILEFMKLQIWCGEKLNDTLFVSETGPLTLGPKDTRFGDNLGSIRVKIFRIH